MVDPQYWILKKLFRREPDILAGDVYRGASKLRVLLGDEFLGRVRGKTVIDFGCGEGREAIELAQHGAARVIGIDIRENLLEQARRHAIEERVDGVCRFGLSAEEKADVIVSLDSFEHFADPAGVLRTMAGLLRPQGEVIASFGPTWYHPLGGHLFSVFPWAHLIFSERALIRWRADFKCDGAVRFQEVAGGLNQMTIHRFEKLVAQSPLRPVKIESVPIRKLRGLHNRWTREFTTAIVRCQLRAVQ
ncbi:MAG: class I SAM-dependent methyltransferase [Terriglobales bacterium]